MSNKKPTETQNTVETPCKRNQAPYNSQSPPNNPWTRGFKGLPSESAPNSRDKRATRAQPFLLKKTSKRPNEMTQAAQGS